MGSDPKNRTPLTKEKAKKAGATAGRRPTARPVPAAGGLEKLSRGQTRLLTASAVVVTVALIGALTWYLLPKFEDKAEKDKYTPSESNRDPSLAIPGIHVATYQPALHVNAFQRVAYDRTPPIGGPHDPTGAACAGSIYAKPVRNENMVSALEHGAVWIAYNPDKLSADGITALKAKVQGQQYLLMSPYPGLASAISLQAWGHQLALDDAGDTRIGQFISALRRNTYLLPVPGGSCAGPRFNAANPPTFDATPPPPNAVPVNGAGITPDKNELNGTRPIPQVPAPVVTPRIQLPATLFPRNPTPATPPAR